MPSRRLRTRKAGTRCKPRGRQRWKQPWPLPQRRWPGREEREESQWPSRSTTSPRSETCIARNRMCRDSKRRRPRRQGSRRARRRAQSAPGRRKTTPRRRLPPAARPKNGDQENLRKLTKLKGNIMIRAPRAATSLHLVARAQEAAQRKNINATVITNTRTTEGPVWSGNRIWDPGD